MKMRLTFWVALIFFLTVGCQQPEATPTTAPPTTSPTEIAIAQTSLPPTSTLPPTPIAAAATFTPIPTSTRPAEPTVTPTVEAIPVWLLAPEDFGDDRSWLTGELVTDPAVLLRRPIAVKISNSPPEYVRPQSGLGQADIVFEHVTEGPITRFTAIIQSQMPEKMGPIRSGRLIDVELPAMYDAAFAYSGSSIGVSQKLFGSDFRSRILRSYEPGYYRTGEDKPLEHTLYGIPESFWESLDESGENVPPNYTNRNHLTFSTEPPDGGESASAVEIRWRQFGTVDWTYDAEINRYWRFADDEEHIDANTGQQISAANVVLVYAIHQQDMSICESQYGNTCSAFSTEIQIWNWGDAVILRDGQQYDVIWKRENRADMLTFWDEDGNQVPLQIGNTWIEVIPYHYTDPVTIFD